MNKELPGYEIIDKVGEGGMSVVYRARQARLDRTVAIKFLTNELSKNPADRQRFDFETKTAAKISHPNIIPIYDAGEIHNNPYYVMEYVSGATLGEFIQMRGKMEEADALHIATSVAEALEYCWDEHRLIHCDIKPENLIMDMQGTPKLADLGLSRIAGLMVSDENDEMTIGTPSYMSPEQAMGVEDLDCRSDIYALGAMLYHMLTGQRIFEGHEDQNILEYQISHCTDDLIDENPSVSHGVAWMVEKMLLKKREERYASWTEVIDDLALIRAGKMIRGGVFEEHHSTMERSTNREIPTALNAQPAAMDGPQTVVMSPVRNLNIKKDVLVAKKKRMQKDERSEAQKVDAGAAFMKLMILMMLTVMLYGVTMIYEKVRQMPAKEIVVAGGPTLTPISQTSSKQTEETKKPTKANQKFNIAAELGEKPPASKPPAQRDQANPNTTTAAAPERPTTSATPSASPAKALGSIEEATALLKMADKEYQTFLSQRDDAARLGKVEKACRKAADIIESNKVDGEDNKELDKLLRKANKMIANVRWTRELQ